MCQRFISHFHRPIEWHLLIYSSFWNIVLNVKLMLVQTGKQISWGHILLLAFLFIFCQTGAQENNPREFVNMLDRARKHSMEQKWTEAAATWLKITRVNPVNGENWAQLAQAYYQLRENDQAISAYKKVIELGYGQLGNSAYNIACNYALKGNKEKALEWLERALNT